MSGTACVQARRTGNGILYASLSSGSHKYAKEILLPLVRIDLRQGASPAYRKAIADGVHAAMIESLAIPPDDRFQVISEREPDSLIYDPQYFGIQRSDKVVFIQITMSVGRKPAQKRVLFKRIGELLSKSPGLRRKTSS